MECEALQHGKVKRRALATIQVGPPITTLFATQPSPDAIAPDKADYAAASTTRPPPI